MQSSHSLNKILANHFEQIITEIEIICRGIVELKIVLVIEERQVKPLIGFRFHRVDRVPDAAANENSKIRKKLHQKLAARSCQEMNVTGHGAEHSLRVNFVTFDNRMLLFVTSIANIKVEISDVISTSRVDTSETLLELLVALTMQASKEIVVLQAMFLLTRCNVIAMIMLTTALVNFWITSKIVIAVSRVSWSAPLSAGKAQIDSFLSLSISLDRRFTHLRLILEGCISHQRLPCHNDFNGN